MIFMKDKVIFGPAGKPIKFRGKAFESPDYLAKRGLHAFEYQSTRGVRIKEEASLTLRDIARRNDVLVSMHGPYYINMCSKEEEKIDASIERLVQCARVGEYMGAYRLVFHPGFYSNRKPEVCMDIAKKAFTRLLERCEEEGIENFTFAPETTGKRSQLGSLDEIIEMCASYNCIFSKLEDNLEIDRLHCHFTTIEYAHGGERKHHTLDESDEYGPHIKDLLLNLIENGWKATIICETPLLDQDALKMKQLYDSLI